MCHIFFQRKDCATILGQVAMLWGMSLAQYHQLEHRKKEVLVARHPQWEWCPQENCNRAVRLKGTGNYVCNQCFYILH